MNVTVTKEQAQAIVQFADIATRQLGLQAAGAALDIAVLFQKAIDAEAGKDGKQD